MYSNVLLYIIKNQYKSPETEAKSKSYRDLGFGNNIEPCQMKDAEHDISILSAVVSKYFSSDCNDDNNDDEDDDHDDEDDDEEDDNENDAVDSSSFNNIPLKGRMRSNSMPELPSASSRYRRK